MSGTALGLFFIGLSDPAETLWLTLLGAFVLAYSGATVDISVDAWRIESAPNDEQASMAAVYTLGYRFAIMFAGVGLILADIASWRTAYWIMAGVMLTSAMLVLLMREPARAPRAAAVGGFLVRAKDAVLEPFSQVLARLKTWALPVLALVAIYRLSDFTMGVMASPLYADLFYPKTVVGSIQIVTPWLIVLGGFIGGFAAAFMGLLRAMLLGAVVTLFTNAAFAWLSLHPVTEGLACLDLAGDALAACRDAVVATPLEVTRLTLVIGADNFAAGFVGTVFIAYMSSLTDRANAATQYALFSSAYAFFCKLIAGFSGVLADAVGWFWFFMITALYAVPPMLLIWLILAKGSDAAKGEADASAPDPEDALGDQKAPA